MYVVAKDGSGDFTSIQAAIDAIPGGGAAPAIVILRMDEYRERVIVNKDNVRIVGEARDRTVITHSACARDKGPDGKDRGTFLSFTVLVTGRNVEMENLTIRNDAGDGRDVGQAVALYAAGDRGVYRNCRLIAHQDTLFCGPVMPKILDDIAPRTADCECVPSVGDCPVTRSREYFEDCFIQGDVDFIFGPYRCFFERCQLHMNARGGYYTAANTPAGQPCGLVFHACCLTGECEKGEAYLGRPWRKFARTAFLECKMEECVAPRGFADWDAERLVTEQYGEYGSYGPGARQDERHSGQKRMTETDARECALPLVIGGWDRWRPDKRIPTWYLCGDSTMADYPWDRAPMTGWGQMLKLFTRDRAWVENCAVNGRSSKSFAAEMRLNLIELCLRPGDKLIVSFSHNDEKADPLRHTDPHTTFPEYLNLYIDAALRQGAEPILATPIARRHFDEAGRLTPTHGAYPEAIRSLAAYRGVRLIDLEKATMRAFQEAGPEGTKKLFCHVAPGTPHYPDGAQDNSHLQREGAARVAALFMDRMEGRVSREEEINAAPAADLGDLIEREDGVLIRKSSEK